MKALLALLLLFAMGCGSTVTVVDWRDPVFRCHYLIAKKRGSVAITPRVSPVTGLPACESFPQTHERKASL